MSKDTVPAIYAAMAKVNEGLNAITKSQKGYGYNFRGIDDVLLALNPLFKEHKIITTRRNLKTERTVRLNAKGKEVVEVFITECEYVFKSLEDGSEIISSGFGEGQDSSGGDKGSSMATSNSYKYVIFEMFNIPTKEQKDSDQVTAETNKSESSKPASNNSFGVSSTLSKPASSGGFGSPVKPTAEKTEIKESSKPSAGFGADKPSETLAETKIPARSGSFGVH